MTNKPEPSAPSRLSGQRFLVTLESTSGWSAPPTIRLRRALKSLRRSFGLRCVHLSEVSCGEICHDHVSEQRQLEVRPCK